MLTLTEMHQLHQLTKINNYSECRDYRSTCAICGRRTRDNSSLCIAHEESNPTEEIMVRI